MNKYVSLELAKMLKEKGFTNDVMGHYKGEDFINNGHFYNFNNPEEQSLWNIELCSAPTIAEVVMWLYENYRIWVWVSCREIEDGTNETIFIGNGRHVPVNKKKGFVIDPVIYNPKNTPSEAYESAIKHVLTNILP